MEEKKHKGGYELLKEKYAKLEAENERLKAENSDKSKTIIHYGQEIIDWKAKYVQADAAKQDAVDRYNRKQTEYAAVTQAYNNTIGKIDEQDFKIAFLLDHCPFWVRWMYRHKFKKGGVE